MTEAIGAGAAQGPAGPRRPPIARKVAFYALFALVDVFAMSKDAFTLGLYFLVLPALVLAAIHWGFLLIPMVDWPLTAWRRTGSRRLVALWFGAALIVPLGVPATLNLVQATEIALDRLGDMEPERPFSPTGPVLVAGECGAVCTDLLASGTFTRLLHSEAADPRDWRDGSVKRAALKLTSTYCPATRRKDEAVSKLHSQPGWCVVTRSVDHPKVSAVVRLEGYKWSPHPRRRRIEIYACTDRCRMIARQTERRGARLATPLQITYVGDSLYLDPQFRRTAYAVGDADPIRVIHAALGVQPGPGKPRLGEDPVRAAQAQTLEAAEGQAQQARTEVERRIRHARDLREELATRAQRQQQQRGSAGRREPPCNPVEFERRGTFGAVCR